MGTVTNDIVLIDDDDSDLEIQELPAVPNGTATSENNEKSKSDSDTESFDVLVRRYLEQDSVIDLVSIDKRPRQASRCMNPYCKHGENPISAPSFVKSYFGLPNSKDQFVCELCLSDVIKHFEDLDRRFLNNESLFKAEFPRSNPVVLIDSDDEDEKPEKEEELCQDFKELLKKCLPDQMLEFLNESNMESQLDNGISSIKDQISQMKMSFAEAKSELTTLEKDSTKSMDNLYASFLPSVKETDRIDIAYEEMRPVMMATTIERRTPIRVRQIQVENNSSTDVDVLMEKKVASLSVPPEGEIIRPKPKQGQRLLVMKIHTFSEWVPGVVEDVITKVVEGGKRKELYRVKITSGKQSYLKEVEGDTLAYMEPPPVRLGVGTRVIALGNASSNARKYANKKFLSGVTGESPTAFNNGRYLVFFDDGYVQYVHHHDLRLVCDPKSNVAEYFQTKTSQEFIRQYLDRYPERHLLKVREMEIIRTECNGQWLNARVKAVDCALVQMLFVKDFRTEWIYRGSTRLHPIFENTKKEIGVFRHRGNTHRSNPVLHYSKIDSSEETVELAPAPTRAVAKKSTAMVRDIGYSRNYRSQKAVPDGEIVERQLGDVLRPRAYRPHSCTGECIRWTNFTVEKAKGQSFLMLPLFYGFIREKTDHMGHENRILYTSPCGKKLRSMKDVHRYLRQTNSDLTIDMFDFDYWVKVCDEFIVPDRFLKIRDLSYGKEEVAIPCVNCVDSSVPAYMDYRTERRGCDGVFLNLDTNFLTCCDCTDDCADKSRCACWQKTIKGFKAIGRVNNVDPSTIGYQFRRLSEVVTTGIYECNKMCKCSQRSCLNRVVQHPLRQKLQLFKTRRKGWGTRCLNDIPAGSFICVYMGDILTENNANEGGKRYGDEYFAELDFIEVVESLKENYEEDVVGGLDPEDDPDHVDENVEDMDFDDIAPESDDEFEPSEYFSEVSGSRMKLRNRKKKGKTPESKKKDDGYNSEEDTCSSEEGRQPRAPSNFQAVMPEDEPEKERLSVRSYYGPEESVYIMDAKTAGNIGRYLNHSCDPNIFVQNVFVDTHDLRFPWVAFFALRYIKAGTELTWDYRYEVGSVPGKKLFRYSESTDCRGRLL